MPNGLIWNFSIEQEVFLHGKIIAPSCGCKY